MIVPVKTLPLAVVLEHLGIPVDHVRSVGDPPSLSRAATLAGVPAKERDLDGAARELVAFARAEGSDDGAVLAFLEGDRKPRELARFRNALWPFAHVAAWYRLSHIAIERVSLAGKEKLRGGTGLHGILLVAYRREQVLAPATTIAKFDQNAAGWDGKPGSPGYAHFRWMRKFVGTFAPAEAGRAAQKILDFGCGAGWVGIEAALANSGAELCAFDPSPEMVKIAEENARKNGIVKFTARTGFGEDPPFPAAGEAPFDLVLSSGVISFAPDASKWLDGLARTVASGGQLVIGDIHRESKGMRKRREAKPLLPAREMNAKTRAEVRVELERRGFAFEAEAGYQLTSPVPELAHWSETRLGGALNPHFLRLNRMRAGRANDHPELFDSWVMRFRRS